MPRISKKNAKRPPKSRVGRWAPLGPAVVLAGLAAWWLWPTPRTGSAFSADEGEPGQTLIVVDAGHGGVDGGTQGFGVLEKTAALDVAVQLAAELRRRGYAVAMVRRDDSRLSLAERVDFANARQPLAFVSVHFNFSTDSAAIRGVETYYAAPKEASVLTALAEALHVPPNAPQLDDASRTLAEETARHVSRHAETPDRGARNRPDLAVVRRTACPAVLVECAYLSHRPDATRAKTAAWRKKLAEGIANGLDAWKKASTTPDPPDVAAAAAR